MNRNFAQKVLSRKCDPLGPVDRPDFHNYILMEILLKKCDVESVTLVCKKKSTKLKNLKNFQKISQLYMNRNFTQKSAT